MSVVLLLSVTSVIAEDQIIVDFYWDKACGDCVDVKMPIINDVIAHYKGNDSVVINKKEVSENITNQDEMYALGIIYPAVVIHNKNIRIDVLGDDITYDSVISAIDNSTPPPTPWYTNLSLPLFTIVLGGLDSFNPS